MRSILVILLGALISAPSYANSVEWFEENTPLTQAHQHLLNDDLPAMFTSLVELWQLDESKTLGPHLNALFTQSLELDCGKALVTKSFPQWIKSVVVERADVQSPGRDSYRAVVQVTSTKRLYSVSLKKWVSKTISADDSLTSTPIKDGDSTEYVYTMRYNMNNWVPEGLYRIDVTAENQDSWSSWLIFGKPKAKQTVRWVSKDHWAIEKNALFNRFCPLPKLDVSVFSYKDGKYDQVWNDSYDSDYPTSLGDNKLPPGRYVLAVSMTHQRWQGSIIVEQTQTISKTYDVSVDD